MPLLPTIMEEEKLSRYRILWKYRLQFQTLASANVIFIAAGMKMAWSVFETPSGKFPSNAITHQLSISWFLGVIVGAVLATTFVQRVTKNFAYCMSGAFLIFGGILFITFPTHFIAIICSCICEGCAYGLTLLQTFVLTGEVAHRGIRGLLASSERIFLWLGICLQLLHTRLWYTFEPSSGYAMSVDQLHGIIIAFLGFIAIMLALMCRIESPLLLQHLQREVAATQTIKRLEGAHYPNLAVLRLRDDYKELLAYDAGQSMWKIFLQFNALPLLKLVVLRSFVALSLSLPFNRAFLTISYSGFGCEMNCIFIMALCGLLGSIAGGMMVDLQGRRKITVVSLLLSVIFISICGGIFKHLQEEQIVTYRLELEMAACLMLLYQLCISAGIAVATSVYTTEAFTITLKSKCIGCIIICEQLANILLALIAFNGDYNNATYFIVIGSSGLLLGLLSFFFMPETKYLPLIECLIKFKKVP